MFGQCADAVIYDAGQADHKVIWSIGLTRKAMSGLKFDIAKANCTLFSTRNWDFDGLDYVPCVSAMAPEFDDIPDPQCEVVVFSHALKSKTLSVPSEIPHLTNHMGTLKDTLLHLAKGEIVVTNSYHGTYWAMLMGRRVLCLPFKDKFNHFRHPPAMSTLEDWQSDLRNTHQCDLNVEMARDLNRSFYEKVMNLS